MGRIGWVGTHGNRRGGSRSWAALSVLAVLGVAAFQHVSMDHSPLLREGTCLAGPICGFIS
jgi:hypothetical protein